MFYSIWLKYCRVGLNFRDQPMMLIRQVQKEEFHQNILAQKAGGLPKTKFEDETNNFIDNTDFCHINKLPIKGSFNKTWQANYMHKMAWRWFPIGDDFVNIFLSRDSDSPIIQREIDAVDAWLKTDMAAHIMRGK